MKLFFRYKTSSKITIQRVWSAEQLEKDCIIFVCIFNYGRESKFIFESKGVIKSFWFNQLQLGKLELP